MSRACTIPNQRSSIECPSIFFLACALCYCSFLCPDFFVFVLFCFHSPLVGAFSVDVPLIFFLSSRPRSTGLATTYITAYG